MLATGIEASSFYSPETGAQMVFSPNDPTPEQQPSRELLVNNARSAATAQFLLREALLADCAGTTTPEQRLILKAHTLQARRTRKLMRAPGA